MAETKPETKSETKYFVQFTGRTEGVNVGGVGYFDPMQEKEVTAEQLVRVRNANDDRFQVREFAMSKPFEPTKPAAPAPATVPATAPAGSPVTVTSPAEMPPTSTPAPIKKEK